MKNFLKILSIVILFSSLNIITHAAEKVEYLKTDWSFKGLFGKFDRGSLQRGYQVYTEVCSSCHSMKYLSYRNLSEKGGPEFSVAQAKAIAASFEVTDGPNADGEMFQRPGKLSDKFVMPYENVKAAEAANGGAYPPDMSVLVKARGGGVDYIYSLLQGYEDAPSGMILDEGVHYNKYMYGNKIKMSAPLSDGIIEICSLYILNINIYVVYHCVSQIGKFTRRTHSIIVLFSCTGAAISSIGGIQFCSNICMCGRLNRM